MRGQGMRNAYGMGFQLNTTNNDSNALFDYFLIAYGEKDIVTRDGKLNVSDPQVREAAIKAVTYPTTAYKDGFVPPGAINWNDADDNNAFPRQADRHGSISTARDFENLAETLAGFVTLGSIQLALGRLARAVRRSLAGSEGPLWLQSRDRRRTARQ